MNRKPKCYASGKSRDFCPYYVFGGACSMFSEDDHIRYCARCFKPEQSESRAWWREVIRAIASMWWLSIPLLILGLGLALTANAAEVRATPGGEWTLKSWMDGNDIIEVVVGNADRHWTLAQSPEPPTWVGNYRLVLEWYGSKRDWTAGKDPIQTSEYAETWSVSYGGCTIIERSMSQWCLAFRLYQSLLIDGNGRRYRWYALDGAAQYCRIVVVRTDADADDILLGEITIGGDDAPTLRIRNYTHRRGGFVAIY